jgi:hypothetical protein
METDWALKTITKDLQHKVSLYYLVLLFLNISCSEIKLIPHRSQC